jgi:catechol 2,3-dioxygenase-like lactoylglutathione lyase family enzyme
MIVDRIATSIRSRRRALFALVAASLAAPVAAEAPAAAPAPQQRTTSLGSREQELLFAKISVSDLSRSYEFYTKVIGLKLASPQLKPPTPGDPEVDFREIPLNFSGSLADPFFVLMKRRGVVPVAAQAELTWVGFKVPDANAAVDRAAAAGAQVVRRPAPGPISYGFVRDPDGYTIEFIQAAANPR